MSTLSGLISAGGGGALPQISLTQSQTWVPPQDGNVCIHVIGAGGSGSAGTGTQYAGGAGGYCKKNSLAVTTSGSYTVVVGVGGIRGSGGSANGGNSTVAGTGLSSTLTANGGTGGSSSSSAGGTAANGDVTNTGGAGNMPGSRGGGGAVGIYGTGNSGHSYIRAGDSDAQGGESGFGHIGGGGKGGIAAYHGVNYNSGNLPQTMAPDASGPFAGGGSTLGVHGNTIFFGGNGGTGAGGGGCSAGTSMSGSGGDGLVLIQYLPS